ncbi:MAG: tRNA (adenosine(37)-N6)-threonylcarbamoyltransferase complex ATPase subunit type 1 TsaE [Marinicaulis sp.]|nr:tRNA (adenosine(37)-N6)-threonylcarbamoyltransferase complex ATPase subunit type 1 TsaE [Marinicaulis sp.]
MEFDTGPFDSESDVESVGRKLAALIRPGDLITLSGPLGAGKTTLARGTIREFCGENFAPSPTFTLVEIYAKGDIELSHFDLYRLKDAEEIWELGFEDALDQGICLIEWPEKINKILPDGRLEISISVESNQRHIHFRHNGAWAERLNRETLNF